MTRFLLYVQTSNGTFIGTCEATTGLDATTMARQRIALMNDIREKNNIPPVEIRYCEAIPVTEDRQLFRVK